MKRPTTPHVTTADLARWRRLLREAGQVTTRDAQPNGDFDKAVRDARRSVVPAGKADKTNPFVRLVRLGQRYVMADRVARGELNVELAGLAAQCSAILDPPGAGQVGSAADGQRGRLPYRDE